MKKMGRNLTGSFLAGLKRVLVLLLPLASGTSTAHADEFIALVGAERFSLNCDGTRVVDAPCRLRVGSAGELAIRFAVAGARHRHARLLKQGLDKVLDNERHPRRPRAADIPMLLGLELDNCHPAEDAGSVSGDILQLCLPKDSSSVVLFVRGLCDRCDFEPVVLEKSVSQKQKTGQ